MTAPKRIRGEALVVGDTIRVMSTYRLVERFETHPGLPGEPARVAVFTDGSKMTVYNSDILDSKELRR